MNIDLDNLHAFKNERCFCPLIPHLIDTMRIVYETRLYKIVKSSAKRVFHKSGLSPETTAQYLLLIPLLHDIGKIHPLLQEGGIYSYHEVLSSMIVYRLLNRNDMYRYMMRLGFEPENYKRLIAITTWSILNHHYALRDLDTGRVYQRLCRVGEGVELLSTAIQVIEELTPLINGLGLNDLSELLKYMSSSKRVDDNILGMLCRVSGLNSFINELGKLVYADSGYRVWERIVNLHISIHTGVTNIADYLAGSLERGGVCGTYGGGFPYMFISSEETRYVRRFIEPCRPINDGV